MPLALTGVSAPKNSAITFKSSDTSVATVSADGTLTPLKAGTVNIAATNSLGAKYVINVTVKKYALQSVKQTRLDAIEAVIAGDISGLKNEDILITCKETNVVYRVKSIAVDSNDKTKVAISTYGSMTNGMHFTVKIDGIEKEFTATDNVVADVSVSPLQIAAGDVGTEVVGQTVDKNGVILNEVYLDGSGNNNNVTFNVKVNATDGYTREKVLVLYRAGNKATAEITYHTYKYENGSEVGVITKTFDIVAVDQLVTTSEYGYTVVRDGVNPDYKAPKTQIPVGAPNDMYAYFQFLDSNNNPVTENYTVETSDRTTLMVADGNAAQASLKVHVVGLKEGSAYINVKDVNGNIVKSLPVTVVAARKIARVQLEESNAVVSSIDLTDTDLMKLEGYEDVRQKSVSIKGYDQYGDPIGIDDNSTVEGIGNTPSGLVARVISGGSIAIDGSNGNEGTYSYKLTVKDDYNRAQQLYSFSVRVVRPTLTPAKANDASVNATKEEKDNAVALENADKRGGKRNYRLIVNPRSYDATITSATTRETYKAIIDVKIGVYESGALIGYLKIENSGGALSQKDEADSNDIRVAKHIFTEVTSGSAVRAYKAIGAGTYRVYAYADLTLDKNTQRIEFYDDITITDSANGASIAKWKVSRFSTTVKDLHKGSADVDKQKAAIEAITQCLDVSCFGDPVAATADNFYVDAADLTVTNNAVFIKKAYVVHQIGTTGIYYAVPFAINLTFTVQ